MSGKVFKAGMLIFVITVASKIMGFIKEMLIANKYGTTYVADAYYIGLTPVTLAITFAVAMGSVFLPMFIKHSNDKRESFAFSNNILMLFFMVTLILYMFLLAFNEQFLNFLAPGVSKVTGDLAIVLLYILFPLVFVVIAIQVYTLMLNAYNNYIQAAATILPNNLLVILYLYFLGDTYGIIGVSIATVLAFTVQLVILYFILKKQEYKIIHNINFWDSRSKEFLVLLFPIIISSAFNQLNAVMDRILASGLEEGAIAALLYAFRLRGIATGLFITPVITLTFPKLAKFSNDKNNIGIAKITQKSLIVILLLLAPLTLIFMSFSREIIEILFERGNFNSNATNMTASVFWAYSLGIIAIGVRDVSIRTFFSRGDTKTPTYIMIAGSIINAILSYFFVNQWGLIGLGLSSSVALIMTAIVITVFLTRKVKNIWSDAFIYTILKIFIITVLIGMFLFYLKQLNIFSFSYFDSRIDQIMSLSAYGILTYILFILLLIVFREKESMKLLRGLLQNKK